jgi:hypothetical protein
LQDKFGDLVERLVAVGDWAIWGVDLRTLPYEEVILLIVLRSAERPLNLYLEIADGVFTDLDDKDILVQFQLATLPEWQDAEIAAQTRGTSESLGVPLMVRR